MNKKLLSENSNPSNSSSPGDGREEQSSSIDGLIDRFVKSSSKWETKSASIGDANGTGLDPIPSLFPLEGGGAARSMGGGTFRSSNCCQSILWCKKKGCCFRADTPPIVNILLLLHPSLFEESFSNNPFSNWWVCLCR